MIKPIPTNDDVQELKNDVVNYYDEVLFSYLLSLLGKKILKDNNELAKELNEGNVYFDKGVLKGTFSAGLLKYLAKTGSVWESNQKGYKIAKFNDVVLLGQWQAKFEKLKLEVLNFVKDVADIDFNANVIKQELVEKTFDNIVAKSLDNLGKVSTVPDIKSSIETATDSINKSVNNFLTITAIKLLQGIRQSKSLKDIKKDVILRKEQAIRQAENLADDSLHFYSGEVRRDFYQANNVKFFKWITKRDNKVRDTHKFLDGKVFAYDDPPIVEGRQILPAVDFGCRCIDEPVENL